ncbi:hypothetical protein [Prevotella falsenii]
MKTWCKEAHRFIFPNRKELVPPLLRSTCIPHFKGEIQAIKV